jgi:hypothetical protein
VHVSSPIMKSLYPISLPDTRLILLISSDNRASLSLNISDNGLCGIHVYSDGSKTGTCNAAGNSDSVDLNVADSHCG